MDVTIWIVKENLMTKVRKRVKTVSRFPRGWWPNTPYHRMTVRIPQFLFDELSKKVEKDPDLLNLNHAIVVAIDTYTKGE